MNRRMFFVPFCFALALVLITTASVDAKIVRLGDSGNQAGAISEADVTFIGGGKVVTSVRDGGGDLKLISWSISADGKTIKRLGDSGGQAGAISLVDSVFVGSNNLITAVRDGGGNLKLISWNVSADGSTIKRLGDSGSQAGALSLLDIVSNGSVLTTSVRDGGGNLKLITWHTSPDKKTIKRAGDSGNQAGALSLLASAASGGAKVINAVRDGGGDLKLISWQISSDGTVKRLGDSGDQAGATGLVSLVTGQSSTTSGLVLVSPVQAGNNDLKLISWTMPPSGALKRAGDSGSQAGEISLLSTVHLAGGNTVTSVRDGGGDLKLILWNVSADGKTVKRISDSGSQAGAMSLVSTAHIGGGQVLNAVRDGGGNLKLITWDVLAP